MAASAFKSNVPVPYVTYSGLFQIGLASEGNDKLFNATVAVNPENVPLTIGGNQDLKRRRIIGEYQTGITTDHYTGDYYGPGIGVFKVLRPSYYLVRARISIPIVAPNTKENADIQAAVIDIQPYVFEGEVEMYSPMKIGLPGVDYHDHNEAASTYYYGVNAPADGWPMPNLSINRRVLLWASYGAIFTFQRGPDGGNPVGSSVLELQFYRLCDQQNFVDWKLPEDDEDA